MAIIYKQQQQQQQQRQKQRHMRGYKCLCLSFYLCLCWIICLSTDTFTVTIMVTALPEIPTKGKHVRGGTNEAPQTSLEDNDMPRFAEPVANVTVSVGRDALLACVVENLKGYKVAWVRVDTQTILSIHHNVISQNNRISLTYNDHRSWYLHIKNVEETDRGWYMCQVNTDPMRSRKGYLQVVVPPVIVESLTSNDMVVREGLNVTLMCKARGYPEPYVMWRREDGEEMLIGGEHVNVVDGELLHITKVSRLHMAAYLCVASNGVPPSISKRVHLKVQFPPMLSIPNQLEGAYVGQDVNLECHTEAYPASINYWTTERGDMIISDTSRAGDKYETTAMVNGYTKYMKLKIRHVGPNDFGTYRCVAKNSLGETDGNIKLDEMPAPTTAVLSEMSILNRSLDGKRRNKNKLDASLNALPDYGVEEWRDGAGPIGGANNNHQASVRNPPVSLTNSAAANVARPFKIIHEIKRQTTIVIRSAVNWMTASMKWIRINAAIKTTEKCHQPTNREEGQRKNPVKDRTENDIEEERDDNDDDDDDDNDEKYLAYLKHENIVKPQWAIAKWFNEMVGLRISWPHLRSPQTILAFLSMAMSLDFNFFNTTFFRILIMIVLIMIMTMVMTMILIIKMMISEGILRLTMRHKMAQPCNHSNWHHKRKRQEMTDDGNDEDDEDDEEYVGNDGDVVESKRSRSRSRWRLRQRATRVTTTRATALGIAAIVAIGNERSRNKCDLSWGHCCSYCRYCRTRNTILNAAIRNDNHKHDSDVVVDVDVKDEDEDDVYGSYDNAFINDDYDRSVRCFGLEVTPTDREQERFFLNNKNWRDLTSRPWKQEKREKYSEFYSNRKLKVFQSLNSPAIGSNVLFSANHVNSPIVVMQLLPETRLLLSILVLLLVYIMNYHPRTDEVRIHNKKYHERQRQQQRQWQRQWQRRRYKEEEYQNFHSASKQIEIFGKSIRQITTTETIIFLSLRNLLMAPDRIIIVLNNETYLGKDFPNIIIIIIIIVVVGVGVGVGVRYMNDNDNDVVNYIYNCFRFPFTLSLSLLSPIATSSSLSSSSSFSLVLDDLVISIEQTNGQYFIVIIFIMSFSLLQSLSVILPFHSISTTAAFR